MFSIVLKCIDHFDLVLDICVRHFCSAIVRVIIGKYYVVYRDAPNLKMLNIAEITINNLNKKNKKIT